MNATIWTKLRCSVLSGISQTQKATDEITPLSQHSEKGKTMGTDDNSVAAWGRDGDHKGLTDICEVMELILYLDKVVVIGLYVFVKIQRAAHQKKKKKSGF